MLPTKPGTQIEFSGKWRRRFWRNLYWSMRVMVNHPPRCDNGPNWTPRPSK